MEEDRVQLDTEEKIQNQISDAFAEHNAVPLINRVLDAAVVLQLTDYNTNLPLSISARNTAQGNEATIVESCNTAFTGLFKRTSAFYNELFGHVDCGDVPVGAFAFFSLDLEGKHPVIESDADLLLWTDRIRLGNIAMLAAGYTPNAGFTAASILALRTPFAAIVLQKGLKKQLAADAEYATQQMLIHAKDTGDEVFAQLKYHSRKQEPGAARDFMRTYGVKFAAPKVKTLIGGHVLLPAGTDAAGAEVRIGEKLTKKGKIAKAGVTDNADAKGHFEVETTESGDTFVNVRILNCADANVPINIEAGTNQKALTIQLVAGVSSL